MNKDIISFKATEYIGRAGVALNRGDLEKAKKDPRTGLVLYRLQARRRWSIWPTIPRSFGPSSEP